MSAETIDPVDLSQRLIRCPSVTPEDAGALDVLAGALEALGFTCHRLPFSESGTPNVDNLYARIGADGPNFCFAGHTDVVPVGDAADWRGDPFVAEIRDGRLYGRGAVDMKSAIAAFVCAAARFIDGRGGAFAGSISLLITGDEEGPAINGTPKMLDWLKAEGEAIDVCLVGEPTNPKKLGEMIKIGRRGSLNASITVQGAQGHVAYPALADNPVPRLLRFLSALDSHVFDEGNAHFPPSNLEITTIDVGNPTTNLIPQTASARLNVRFNDLHTGADIVAFLEQTRLRCAGDSEMTARISGESFLTPPGPLSDLVAAAVRGVTNREPELSTTGGTSDARFIKNHCPVVEFGLTNETAHKVDENVAVDDIRMLTDIYEAVLNAYFVTR